METNDAEVNAKSKATTDDIARKLLVMLKDFQYDLEGMIDIIKFTIADCKDSVNGNPESSMELISIWESSLKAMGDATTDWYEKHDFGIFNNK